MTLAGNGRILGCRAAVFLSLADDAGLVGRVVEQKVLALFHTQSYPEPLIDENGGAMTSAMTTMRQRTDQTVPELRTSAKPNLCGGFPRKNHRATYFRLK
jgi:hypothetical protein